MTTRMSTSRVARRRLQKGQKCVDVMVGAGGIWVAVYREWWWCCGGCAVLSPASLKLFDALGRH